MIQLNPELPKIDRSTLERVVNQATRAEMEEMVQLVKDKFQIFREEEVVLESGRTARLQVMRNDLTPAEDLLYRVVIGATVLNDQVNLVQLTMF